MFVAACIQLRSTEDVSSNLDRAESLVRRAAHRGAQLVLTPEHTPFLGSLERKAALAEPVGGPVTQRFSELARELRIHLLLGSFAEQGPGDGRCYNTSVLFGPDGSVLATYRKLHLFDVDVPGGLSLRESGHVAPGSELVVARCELGALGLSICYDLRFPELYRGLVERGAELLAVPAAFTLVTGKEHWHVLLRARAIETGSWVLAPAQWGRHDPEGRRRSYGHALIADPWGTVVAQCGEGEGFCLAEVDLERVAAAREAIPVARHRRLPLGD